MTTFIKGRELCRGFFNDCARSIIESRYPGLKYSAGLLGYGSDVLGYDDATSSDHMWGPRFYLFLDEGDMDKRHGIIEALGNELPVTYRGYSTHFSDEDPNDGGIRHAEYVDCGPVSPLVFTCIWDNFIQGYLGVSPTHMPSHAEWLCFSEHRLLALSRADWYVDGLGVAYTLDKYAYYPQEVWLYLLASSWSLVAEEQAFVKRTAVCGDDVGSAIIAARIAERLMRLCFLYNKTYAPYSKWFGTAYNALDIPNALRDAIAAAVHATDIHERENNIANAQRLLGEIHNASGITPPVDVSIRSYYGRDIKVIFADHIANAIAQRLQGTPLQDVPLVGTLSSIGNFCAINDDPVHHCRTIHLYQPV